MKTILVVDDSKLSLASARNVLKDAYKVISVTKGEQAISYLENSDCDVVLLDIKMPEMDGFEVLERIRGMEKGKDMPVIFLTADNDAETETLCFQKGALDFIAKPFVPDVMLSRVGRILEIEELRHRLEDKLEQKTKEVSDFRSKSRQDGLTGLWNRMYTEERVNALLREGSKGALMMIDLDNFKRINDDFGHIVGDRTLRMFADVLRESCAEDDVLCRIGGDEFVIYVKDASSKEELGVCATKIIDCLNRKIEDGGVEMNTTLSIGIAQVPDDGDDFMSLYGCADKALYYVKQNGKNAFHFFSDKIQAEMERSGRAVDLQYLQNLMNRSDNGIGAYLMDFDSFHHVYNFIRRFVERNNRDVQTVLFTVSENGNRRMEASEADYALEMLGKAVYTSLRRTDVSTRYSSKQLVVILMDSNTENGDMVAERIIENFNKFYTKEPVRIDYGIARVNSRGD